MDEAATFDVFLSYSRADAAAVGRLAEGLRQHELSVFLDRDYLAAGQAWPELLERQLRACRAVAVCLGPEGLGPWQRREQYVALDRKAHDDAFPVVPVLLPGAKDLPLGFLRLQTWVDLRGGLGDARALDALAKALRGQPPAESDAPDLRPAVCPYRGLEPFREEDAASSFVGREAFTGALVEKVGRTPLLGVVGASGSGKSSVVLAGLVPQLRRGADGRVWEVGVMRPGRHPLRQLAAAFLHPEPDGDAFDQIAALRKRATLLADGELTLVDVVNQVLKEQPGTERLLLVVDQWEELYTQTLDAEERAAFLRVLLEGLNAAPPLTLVLTLRGDFYGRALEDRALADRLQDAVVNVGPMRREELERAIIEPARLVGHAFEDGLVEDILDEVGAEPGGLPLLEFLLKELWDQRERGGLLSFAAYHRTGGVKRAVAARAEAELKKLSAEQQAAARRFLVRLVTPGEGREDTRARTAIPANDADVREVIERFARARLLTTGRDPASGREVVEVGHEALIREWDTLKGWVDRDRELLRTIERVKAAQRHWEEHGRPADLLLPPGRRLEEARELLARPDAEIEDVRPFIEASVQAEEARRAEKHRQLEEERRREVAVAKRVAEEQRRRAEAEVARSKEQRRRAEAEQARAKEQAAAAGRARRLRNLASAAAVVLLMVSVAAGYFWYEAGQQLDLVEQADAAAREQAIRAQQAEREALANETRALAALSEAASLQGWHTDGLRLALASWPRHADDPRPKLGRSLRAMGLATEGRVEAIPPLRHEAGVNTAAFSPDGAWVVTASEDRAARLWDIGWPRGPITAVACALIRDKDMTDLADRYGVRIREAICGAGMPVPDLAGLEPGWRMGPVADAAPPSHLSHQASSSGTEWRVPPAWVTPPATAP